MRSEAAWTRGVLWPIATSPRACCDARRSSTGAEAEPAMTWGELAVVRALKDPLDQYVYLRDLRAVDEPGFWRLLTAHAAELLPVVYTPTVGDAALSYHALPISPQGLYVTSDDAGRVADVLAAWPHKVRAQRPPAGACVLASAAQWGRRLTKTRRPPRPLTLRLPRARRRAAHLGRRAHGRRARAGAGRPGRGRAGHQRGQDLSLHSHGWRSAFRLPAALPGRGHG